MAINLEIDEKDPIKMVLGVPVSRTMLQRYKDVAHRLSERNEKLRLHKFTRERIDQLLTELETKLNEAG
jgi:hypothetical protein